MPNIKGAIKRVKQSAAANEQNSHVKASMRTAIRKADAALTNKEENAEELLRDAVKQLDTAARKGLIPRNTAARQKSRLTKKAQ
ncbi:30S ribosomal protein S20 [Sporosarcina sp. P18a]|uniref:30S ribosomal protein S20 n=1 Tax=unclassified Sporosarcina TaxID=2647733 RepID=UPI000C16B8E4|nr:MULTISPECIES: 30S ribosomal protein S20 [unclassified Sporosarcina]PIC72057.1 30S ribosomal protein S20 [Sporosarcina sp. P16b]PIC81141.1 30S ribosomal protein S20 [Sporosarcina sp. P18a]PID02179.1 30S ribosomal protein S20 [Sporosarcina sp. P2]PID23826.1 30S ribosomal protein S20 [Sporosarcina sp. P7]